MPISTHLGALLCVALIAGGQVLFKLAASGMKAGGGLFDARLVVIVTSALIIYALATVLWIALLQNAPLGRLYPYMALSFLLVAAASWFFFQEAITAGHMAGLGLIMAGLVVMAVAG